MNKKLDTTFDTIIKVIRQLLTSKSVENQIKGAYLFIDLVKATTKY